MIWYSGIELEDYVGSKIKRRSEKISTRHAEKQVGGLIGRMTDLK
jgi:hypothetical protein